MLIQLKILQKIPFLYNSILNNIIFIHFVNFTIFHLYHIKKEDFDFLL